MKMQGSVKQRLIKFLKYKKIGQLKFAKLIDVSDGYVNAMRKSMQPEVIYNIAINFPELDIRWLMTGIGDMLLTKTDVLADSDTAKLFTIIENMQEEIKNLQEEIKNKQRTIERLEKGGAKGDAGCADVKSVG